MHRAIIAGPHFHHHERYGNAMSERMRQVRGRPIPPEAASALQLVEDAVPQYLKSLPRILDGLAETHTDKPDVLVAIDRMRAAGDELIVALARQATIAHSPSGERRQGHR
jgi:hypothetical protein